MDICADGEEGPSPSKQGGHSVNRRLPRGHLELTLQGQRLCGEVTGLNAMQTQWNCPAYGGVETPWVIQEGSHPWASPASTCFPAPFCPLPPSGTQHLLFLMHSFTKVGSVFIFLSSLALWKGHQSFSCQDMLKPNSLTWGVCA